MIRWSKDWKLWTYITCGAILGVVELIAATTGPAGDTISERVWALGWPVATVIGLGCMVLGIHFAFQGRKTVESDHEFPVEDFERNGVHIFTEEELDDLTRQHMQAWADGREDHADEEEDG